MKALCRRYIPVLRLVIYCKLAIITNNISQEKKRTPSPKPISNAVFVTLELFWWSKGPALADFYSLSFTFIEYTLMTVAGTVSSPCSNVTWPSLRIFQIPDPVLGVYTHFILAFHNNLVRHSLQIPYLTDKGMKLEEVK